MNKRVVTTTDAPRPAGIYSQGIIANGFLYTAGLGPQDPATGEIAASIGEQTRQVLRNVEAVLREAGAGLDDVVKMTTHLQNLKRDFDEYDEVCGEFFNEPYPARTTVGSQLYDILVEIDVVAQLPTVP